MKLISTLAMMVLLGPLTLMASGQDSVRVNLSLGPGKFVREISIEGDANSLAGKLYKEMKETYGEIVCGEWCGGFARVNGLETINLDTIELLKRNEMGTIYSLRIFPSSVKLESSTDAKTKLFKMVNQFSNENVGQLLIREQGGRTQLTFTGEFVDSFKEIVGKERKEFVNDLQTLDKVSSLVKCRFGNKSKTSSMSSSLCILENKNL